MSQDNGYSLGVDDYPKDAPLDEDASGKRVRSTPIATTAPVEAEVQWIDTPTIFAPKSDVSWVSKQLGLAPGRVGLLAGYSGDGKTFLGQSMAVSIVSCLPIWSHFPSNDIPGNVSHVDFEQGPATERRYQRIAIGMGADPDKMGNRLRLATFPAALYLDREGAREAFTRACDGQTLCFVDSLRAAAPGIDENSSDIRRVLDSLTFASIKTGCAILLAHHCGKRTDAHGADPRTAVRGSSGIFDACGTVLCITGGSKGATRRLSQLKVPADGTGAAMEDVLLVIEDTGRVGDIEGLRVVASPLQAPTAAGLATYERDATALLAIVRDKAGASQNAILMKAGGKRERLRNVLDLMVEQERLKMVPGPNGAKTYFPGSES